MTDYPVDVQFQERFWGSEPLRPDDERDEYQRDRARIIHSAAFRRLQAKTQVMGVGEGDYHRTRLTHSIEAAQIGEGILNVLGRKYREKIQVSQWLPSSYLVLAACYAHDLGHPPFGHGGERALHERMAEAGGFEGNGQTLRILTRLEKYSPRQGINPTRRLILSVLKYPVPYSAFDTTKYRKKPPKCYFDTETDIVSWALIPFTQAERHIFRTALKDGMPRHRTLDCSLMECADDVAFGVHDLEDIVARHLVPRPEIRSAVEGIFKQLGPRIGDPCKCVELEDFESLYESSGERKKFCGKLTNLFITSAEVRTEDEFEHPLLRYRIALPRPLDEFLAELKNITYKLVVQQAEIQQLESRGQRIVGSLYDELHAAPERLIPKDAWASLGEDDSPERRVCDYIAGMTDPYAEKIYRRLFVPGFGSSRDEL
jgi:dGTPase